GSLQATENAVRAPPQIAAASGEVLYRSDQWHEGTETTLPVQFEIPAADGEPVLQLTLLEDITDLLEVSERTQWSSTLAFVGITLVALFIAVVMLSRFIFAP